VAVRAFAQEVSDGEELLAALVASAQEKLASGEFGEWMRIERVLRPETESLPVEATTLYAQHGFALKYVELEMARALDDIPIAGPVAGVTFEQWTPERDTAICDAYNDAFSTRGFEGYSADDWVFDSFSVQDEFLPDCSFLALSGGEIIGFSMCVEEAGEGWIDSAGVRPAWRGQGIGHALLARSMQSMREAGIKGAVLRVNEDNPRAIAVYNRLGFEVRRQHAVWQKALALP
jgi:ribosomal protein S18 acetylase RimI-like enzyme